MVALSFSLNVLISGFTGVEGRIPRWATLCQRTCGVQKAQT